MRSFKGGVAVSQIILLVLGILVLAVVAYLLYTQFVTTGSTLSAETCRAEATRICTGCQIGGSPAGSCPYTATAIDNTGATVDSSMERCLGQNSVPGSVAANTIDCTKITGSGSGIPGGGNDDSSSTDATDAEELTRTTGISG